MSGRRRWLSLAEFVGVLGLLIAALSLYFTWSDRRQSAAEKAGEAHARGVVQLDGTPEQGGDALRLSDPAHKLAGIAVRFPAPLAAGNRVGLDDPAIEADWIARPLLDIARTAGVKSGRVPVLIAADWWDADTRRTDRAIYDLAWHSDGHWLRGRSLRLDGLTLHDHRAGQARLDALWAADRPR